MCVLSIKVPIRKKSGNLFNEPRNCFSVRIAYSSIPFRLYLSAAKNLKTDLYPILQNSDLPLFYICAHFTYLNVQ